MKSCIRLPLAFDPAPLAADVGALSPLDWIPHYNSTLYQGDWSGAPLRSVGGLARQIFPDPTPSTPFQDTEVLGRCPALAAALDRFECDKLAVRLLRLGPGASVREHTDFELGYEHGEVRFHVPVLTNPDTVFEHEGREVRMQPGETWYLDFSRPHRVANGGTEPRVHLVVDCVVNDWVTRTLEAGEPC